MAVSKYLQKVQGNSSSTTLSSAISNSDTAAPLTSDTAFDGEGMVIIDEGQSTEEFAYGTGKVGSSITILPDDRGLEGGSAQAHGSQATVKGILTAGMWNNLITSISKWFSPVSGAVAPALGSDADGDMYYRASSVLARLAKGTASQQLRMNSGATAPEWFTPSAAASFWTDFSGAYASGTTITVSGVDVTSIFKKGVSLKWLSSADALKVGKVVSSSFSTDTTITIVGSTVAAGDKSFYYGADVMSETFIIPGNQSTGTNVSKQWTNKTPVYEISVDAIVGTAGTTNSTDYDLNIGGSTKITTKPSIASTATTDLDNVVDNVTTEVAVNSVHTVDIDAASTTQAIDGYVTLFFIPSWWIART